ncbi:MAG TPA: DNA polymerase III subunit [Pirellulales bacterium]|nr:DNA polymerase III subunit [Pirellulales bacterium]
MWQGIEGHDAIVDMFRRTLERGRLASTYLFVGPSGVGKRTFAHRLAQALLCRASPAQRLEPCGRCESCLMAQAGTHPDILEVAKPADRAEIPVRLLIGAGERRMQEGLCHDLWQKPLPGSRRIAVIDDADDLNEEGANCLLKTLEEPPPGAVIFLIGTSAQRQLPTIRSRAQLVRFQPLEPATVARLLVERGMVADEAEAARIAQYSDGSLERAGELLDADYWTFRRTWLAELADPRASVLEASKQLLAFVEEAGKEAAARRKRLRQAIDLTTDFFMELARVLAGAPNLGDDEIRRASQRRSETWLTGDEGALEAAARCLEAREQVERYVNQATLVECWLDDLASIAESNTQVAK